MNSVLPPYIGSSCTMCDPYNHHVYSMMHISTNSLLIRSPLLILTSCAWFLSGILTLFSGSPSYIYLAFWLLLLGIVLPSVCASWVVISITATVILSDGTSQPNILLKTPSLFPLLLGTDGPPPGWTTSVSTLLKYLLRPYVDIFSSKKLPPLSLNNKNIFLYTHISLPVYTMSYFPYIVNKYCANSVTSNESLCETFIS